MAALNELTIPIIFVLFAIGVQRSTGELPGEYLFIDDFELILLFTFYLYELRERKVCNVVIFVCSLSSQVVHILYRQYFANFSTNLKF